MTARDSDWMQRTADALAVAFVLFVVFFTMQGPLQTLSDWLVETLTTGYEDLSSRNKRAARKETFLGPLLQGLKTYVFSKTGLLYGVPILVSLLIVALGRGDTGRIRTLNQVMAAASLVVFGAWIWEFYTRDSGLIHEADALDLILLPLALLLIFIFTFRNFGGFIVAFALFWFLYFLFRGWVPDAIPLFGGASDKSLMQNLTTLANDAWVNTGGIFGTPLQTVSRNVLIFIVFGSVLMASGAGSLLMKVANRLTGRFVGGAAHAAVASSAMFGTLSGAAISNVVTTGVMTIPVIKRAGFKPSFAGAVEAAASTGGQVVPPVMGVVAFFVAAETSVPYSYILVAAIMPALFYYLGVFLTVYFEARKTGTGGVPAAQIERLTRREWGQTLVFVIPLTVLTYFLLTQPSIPLAGFWGFVAALVCSLVLFPQFRSWARIYEAFVSAGRMAATIMIIVAMIGVIIQFLNGSGFSNSLARFIAETAGSAPLLIILIVVALGAIVLGMGLPPGATYFIIVIALASGIEAGDLPTLSLHLFVVFFAVMSTVTPPVALAAFAAAPIAGASPIRTGFQASRLAVAGFIIPFVFAFHPALIYKLLTLFEWFGGKTVRHRNLIDMETITWADFGWITLALSVSLWLLTSALIGFEQNRLALWERLGRILVGFGLLMPNFSVALPALGLAAALIIGHRFLDGEPPDFTRRARPDINLR